MKIKIIALLLLLTGGMLYGQTSGSGVDFIYAKKLYDEGMYDLSARQFHDFAEQNPESPQAAEALVLAGDSYFERGEFENARKEYIFLVLRFPKASNLAEAHFRIGETFREQGNYDEAAKAFQQVNQFYPRSQIAGKAALEAAKMFVKSKQFEQAIEIYFNFLEQNPTSPQALEIQLQLARTYKIMGKLQRALNETEKIITTTKKGVMRAQAQMLHADIEESFGKIHQAEQIYLDVLAEYNASQGKYDDVLALANYKLARIYQAKGQFKQSNKYLDAPQISNLNHGELQNAIIIRGDNYFNNKEYTEAIKNYQEVLEKTDNLELRYKIGLSYEKLADFQKAIDHFNQLLEKCQKDQLDGAPYCEQSQMALSRNYLNLGQTQIALRCLNDFEMYYPDSKCRDQVRFKRAKIYETELQEYERALRIYYEFIEDFPASPLVDDAQIGIGHCFESQRNFQQAVREYEKYLRFYPGGDDYEKVSARIDYLNKFFVKQETGALNTFASLLGQVISEPQQETLNFKLALAYFNELKDYQTAISLLKKSMETEDGSFPRDEMLYYLATSYRYLGEKEMFEQNTKSAFLDSAQHYYMQLIESNPTSQWSDNAVISILKTKLIQTDSFKTKNKIYKEVLIPFIANYPASELMDYAHYHYAKALISGSMTMSDSATVFLNLMKVIKDFPQSEFVAPANFASAQAHLQIKDTTKAINDFASYIDKYPRSAHIVHAHFLLAELHEKQGNYNAALNFFKKLASTFFYSNYADSANKRIGQIYLKTSKYSDGFQYFYNLLNVMPVACVGNHTNGSSLKGEFIYWLARFADKLDNTKDALNYYLSYLRQFPQGKYVEKALYQVAGLYHTNNSFDQEVALNFLRRLLNEFPNSTFNYQAHLQSGDILFKQEQFINARNEYLAAVKLAHKDEQTVYPKMKAIICLYRSDQVAKADNEMKQFDRDFSDIDNYLGQIEIAKGDYYFQRKYFKTAEDVYKSARSKFKKTEYGPLAELKLGKLYLTLNKDEEALKILTEMPEKQDGNKVIPEVYITLGEFYYFKARQPENAMLAFKNAIEQPNIEEPVLAKGMSYLIKAYFDLQLLDQALAVSRKYVERFPLAENVFDIRIQIGIIYNKLNEYDRAIDYLKKLKHEADTESEPRIQYWIADCYFEKGYFQQSIIEYLKVRYISKPSKLNWAVTAQYKAGLAYMKLGKNDEARQIFQKIIIEQGAASPFGKGAQKKIDEIDQK